MYYEINGATKETWEQWNLLKHSYVCSILIFMLAYISTQGLL